MVFSAVFDTISGILYYPPTAVGIALLALIVSLYTFYLHIGTSHKWKLDKKHFVFSMVPFGDFYSTWKDFLKLISVLFTGATMFLFITYSEEFRVIENIQKGIFAVKSDFVKGSFDRTVIATAVTAGTTKTPEEEIAFSVGKGVSIVHDEIEVVVSAPKVLNQKSSIAPTIKVSKPAIKEEVKEKILAPLPPKPHATGPAPDITLSVLSQYGSQLVEGESASFSIIVQNEGTADIEENFNIQLFIDEGNNGIRDIPFSRLSMSPLKVGEQETKIWKNAWLQKGGTHRAEVCADIDDNVLETNEENNCASLVFTVKSPETYGDFVAQNPVMIPESPQLGENISLSVQIANIDTVHSVPVAHIYLIIDDVVFGKTKISSIAPGGVIPLSWQTIWKASAGPHTYKICADEDKKVIEQNEDNNCTGGAFSVPEN